MADLKTLEDRVTALEERIKYLEKDRDYMDALYQKAKELVVKNGKISAIFLQKKLLIDYERAVALLEMLKKD